jgi:hypothetical protein
VRLSVHTLEVLESLDMEIGEVTFLEMEMAIKMEME